MALRVNMIFVFKSKRIRDDGDFIREPVL